MIEGIRIGVYGASGSGKTTKALALIENQQRVIATTTKPKDFVARGFVLIDVDDVAEAIRANYASGFKFVVHLTYKEEVSKLDTVAEAVFKIQQAATRLGWRRTVTIVADELATSFPNPMKDEFYGFGRVCSEGRDWSIHVIGITQRIKEICMTWRGNQTGFYVFRPGDPTDMQTMLNMVPKALHDRLQRLPDYKFIYVEQGRVATG